MSTSTASSKPGNTSNSKNSYLELMKRLQDHETYFQYCLKIQEFGTKKLIPFSMNPIQKILHSVAQKQHQKEKHVRIIVLKARRAGISTYIQARMFKYAATNFNKKCHITTHSKDTTQEMFNMARMYSENYPKQIKPDMYYSGKSELWWGAKDGGGLNSSYSLSTVEGSEVRGSAIDMLHCSEVASWGNRAREYATGLMNCVVTGHNTEIWIESTAQGVGNFFYKEYWRADKNESAFQTVFFPWYMMREYKMDFADENEKDQFMDSLGREERYGGKEEKDLIQRSVSFDTEDGEQRFAVTPENMKWRRYMIDGNCQGDLNIFHQEYPSYAREAFVASGRSAFDSNALSQIYFEAEEFRKITPGRKFAVPVNEFKDIHGLSGMRYYLDPNKDAEFLVWYPPREGRQYRIGVDVAEGILVDGKSDFSVITVMDAEGYEEVATWSGKIDPDLLAWVCTTIARWYKNALLCVENNNHGLVTLKFLQQIHHYENLYVEKALDEKGQRTKKKLGFSTNLRTRPLILDHLRQLIRERVLAVHSKETIDELQTFVIHANGKEAAQSGSHDDRVMSLALACYMIHMYPFEETQPAYFPQTRGNREIYVGA